MSRRRKRSDRVDNPFDDTTEKRQSRRARKKENPRRRWPYLLLIFSGFVALLPNLLGWSGLHRPVVNYALANFDGRVSVDRMRLGWFQRVNLSGVKAVDKEGSELLTIDAVSTSKTLVQLISTYFRGNNFGEVIVTAPSARLHLRPDGSNLEDALAKFLKASTSRLARGAPTKQPASGQASPGNLPKAVVRVADGRAIISSSTDNQVWQIDGLQLLLESSNEKSPVTVDTDFSVTQMSVAADGKLQPNQAGKLSLKTQLDPGSSELLLQSIELALIAENLPVSFAGPLAQRFVGPARSGGSLTAQVQSKIDLKRLVFGLDVQSLNLRELALVAPQLLGTDQINIRNLDANGGLQLSPQMISSNNFLLQSDFGKVRSNGSFDVSQLAQLTSNGKLLNEPLDLNGEIDLAGLVRMLPTTFKLHEDLQVESGIITFQANTKSSGETRRLVFQADAANLKGRRSGRALVWQHPLKLGGTISQIGNELALESLDCQTDFLRLAGNATMESGSFAVKGDLSKLVERAGQFVDLTGIELAGTIDGNFGWQAADGVSLTSNTPMPIQLGGQFRLDQPVIQLPNLPLWQPAQLMIKFSGAGLAQLDAHTSATKLEVQSGGARIDIGNENATAILASPWKSRDDPFSFNCEINGSIAGWLAHLRNFVDLGDLQADGQLALKGLTTFQAGQLQLSALQYQAEQFAFDGYGMKIRDPNVNGTIDGSYDLSRNEVRLRDVTLISSAVAARGQNLRVAFADKFYADGGIGFRGDVNRLAEWFELSTKPDSIYWYGSAEGMLQFVSQEQGVAGKVSATLVDLIAAQQQLVSAPLSDAVGRTEWVELYRDPRVQIDSQMVIADDFSAILLQNGTIKSSSINLEASGTVADLTGTFVTNIQGRWNPAWDKVQALLAAYTGNILRLSGSGTKPFSIRGPLLAATTNASGPTSLLPPELEGAIAVGWDQGSFLDVPIGASEINVDVKNSIGYIGTKGIPFSGGSIQLAPYVDMRGDNPVVMMKPTRIIDNVALSQDTARKWLKFIAPLVADATSAQGSLTLDMESLQMPVMNPLAIEANGTIQLSDVVVGAGPLADQLLGTVQQVRALLKPDAGDRELKTWLQLSQQTVPFVIKDQMVYHENVTLVVKDVTITTSGSVGFDQSLRMMAEIPIADEWIAGKSYLSGLKGQKLRIPIGGTVTRPELDRRAVQGLTAELARTAAGSAINQAITDKLAPKANELQEKVNERFTGELNKLQDRVGEKVGGAFGQLPNIGSGLPNLGGTIGILPNTTGNGAVPQGGGNAGSGTNSPDNSSNTPAELGKNLEDELKKGFNDLFKRKN